MRIRSSALSLLAGLVLSCAAVFAHAQAREEGRLLIASEVLEDLRATPDKAIPDRLLERAYAIAVIPDLTKVAFFAGGRHGNGVMVVRDSKGRFSDPVFVSMTGGSFGWQWGVQSTDIVLVFTTERGVQGIAGGKITLGADASAAAGPVGRMASAATDANFKAEVYSYSRNRGAFVGISLDGTALRIDDTANANFYKKQVMASDIISGAVTTSDDSAKRFLTAVATSTGGQRTASLAAPAATATPGATAAASSAAPASAPSPAAQSFPMSDPTPGQEPKGK
ncbi:MAG TPA: lipid-binding SYLF domain-containing protein [Steroidobacteraceae bacterium]|jgi:lipid-binding SYLF domain-containing protein|nr:lipid-binding SYLF domain-containing protein [Steroidobacteraceae bacterium]